MSFSMNREDYKSFLHEIINLWSEPGKLGCLKEGKVSHLVRKFCSELILPNLYPHVLTIHYGCVHEGVQDANIGQ